MSLKTLKFSMFIEISAKTFFLLCGALLTLSEVEAASKKAVVANYGRGGGTTVSIITDFDTNNPKTQTIGDFDLPVYGAITPDGQKSACHKCW